MLFGASEQDKTGKIWYVKNYCHMKKKPEISDGSDTNLTTPITVSIYACSPELQTQKMVRDLYFILDFDS